MHVRDLKLDNALLDDDFPPRLKLCDFGFARAWDAESTHMQTQLGCAVSTGAPLHEVSTTVLPGSATALACFQLVFVQGPIPASAMMHRLHERRHFKISSVREEAGHC